jgi:hypothetical protein
MRTCDEIVETRDAQGKLRARNLCGKEVTRFYRWKFTKRPRYSAKCAAHAFSPENMLGFVEVVEDEYSVFEVMEI